MIPTDKLDHKIKPLLFSVFFLSGMSGLVYQVAWSRLLTLVIGVGIFAITAVICTFMAGLGLGSYVFGRWGKGLVRPFRAYALIEAAVGAYAVATPWLFEAAQPIYAEAFNDYGRSGLNLFRILLSTGLLIVPTFLMGGTLPLLARAVSALRLNAASGIGLLYSVNTFGAVAGCGLAGFILLGTVGIRASLFLAAGMNFLIAAAVMAYPAARDLQDSCPDGPEESTSTLATRLSDSRFLLALFFISGFAALGYEVLWTRALLVHLRASTYAFSVMLCVYLLGIAGGSALVSPWAGRLRRPLLAVGLCHLGIVVSVVAGMLVFPDLRRLGGVLSGSHVIDSFSQAVLSMGSQAAIVLLLPTLFMGAAFPLGMAAYHRGRSELGRSVGSLYASNTAGNIAGSILVGFFAIEILGVRGSMLALVGVNLTCLVAVLGRHASPKLRRGSLLAGGVGVLAGVFMVDSAVPKQVFYDSLAGPNFEIVYYREGASDTVAVVENNKNRARTLVYSDGRGAAGTHTLHWNLYFGHLPMLLHENPKDALHICYGSGNSVLALTRHRPDRVDVVELSPHVQEASSYFGTNEDVLENPIVNLVIEDGRNFLLGTERSYDVISLEPPNIYTAGVVNLYSREFYELAIDRLRPNGVMVQWLPTVQLAEGDRGMLIRAFTEAFPHVAVFQQLRSSTLLLVGTREPLRLEIAKLETRLQAPGMDKDMAAMGVENAYDFLSWLLLDDGQVRELVKAYEPVTDDLTSVDYSIPRFMGAGYGFSIYDRPIRDGDKTPRDVAQERQEEYASWVAPAGALLQDRCEAARLDRAIELRSQGKDGADAATILIPGC